MTHGLIAALLTFAAASGALAGPPPLSQERGLHSRIDAERLYLDPGWLGLLAYRRLPLHSGWRSQADEPSFFLAPDGKTDPRAEMHASADAFFGSSAARGGDEAARCRFPARYVWLGEKLGLEPRAGLFEPCPALARWYETVAADSVTINFASSYLESPSSMFGHTFLRFEREGTPTLLSVTSNYEADTSRSPRGAGYVVRGLFGGFPGVAGELPYYRRLRRYGDIDGRDVWEYPLRLDAHQRELLALSLWETKDGAFDYFFIGENCSYRTLATVGAAVPDEKLLDSFPLETVPVETIRVLQERGLLGPVRYRPSPVRTVRRHARDLSPTELRSVLALARGERRPEEIAAWPAQRRALVLRAAAEYSSILIHRGELDFETRARVTKSLLEARLALSAALPEDAPDLPPGLETEHGPSAPETGHGGRMLSLGWSNRADNDAAEVGVSGFRHDRIDRLAGYARGAEIEVFGARARVTEHGEVDLDHAWLLRVESSAASDWLFRHPAWSLRLGAQRKSVDNDRPVVGTLSGAWGRAFDVRVGVLALTLGAALDSSSKLRGGIAMEAVVEARLTRQERWASYELFAEHGRYAFGDESHRSAYGLRIGVPLARRYGLVASFERSGAYSEENTVRVELRTFF